MTVNPGALHRKKGYLHLQEVNAWGKEHWRSCTSLSSKACTGSQKLQAGNPCKSLREATTQDTLHVLCYCRVPIQYQVRCEYLGHYKVQLRTPGFWDVMRDHWVSGSRRFERIYFNFLRNAIQRSSVKSRSSNIFLVDEAKFCLQGPAISFIIKPRVTGQLCVQL